jgi:predicted RNA-binding protein with PIN domain
MSYRAGLKNYFIDGYNVVFSGGLSLYDNSIETARFNLLRLLSHYVMKKKVKMTVVWDGGAGGRYPKSETINGIQNIYTPKGLSADEQIVKMVEKMENPGCVTVVSNDRRHITGIVHNLGAQTMSVSKFLLLIEVGRQRKSSSNYRKTGRTHTDISKEKRDADDLSLDEWLRLFKDKNKRGGYNNAT